MSDSGNFGGRVIAGRYRLAARLGQGGMGSVWRADDLTLDSPVAIKLIDPALAESEHVRTRFYQEAKAGAALRSPHVVQILDYGVDGDVPFIAMELLDGESLADRLARVRTPHPAELSRIFGDVARAVRRAHDAAIIHRDLKPENIFLVRNDEQEIAKVLDFGIAKTSFVSGAQGAETSTGMLLGTLPYMSPEQARGAKVDWRTDLWSLGVIAFECVCGRLPFLADAPGELVLEICAKPLPVPSQVAPVPRGFDEWFARATRREPAERFQSAKEMADALRVILQTSPSVPETLVGVGAGAAAAGGPAAGLAEPGSAAASIAQASGGPTGAQAPRIEPVAVLPVGARRETINGGATFDRSSVRPPRWSTSARVGAAVGGVTLAALALLVGLTVRRGGDGPAGAAAEAPSAAPAERAPPPAAAGATAGAPAALAESAAPSAAAAPAAEAPSVEAPSRPTTTPAAPLAPPPKQAKTSAPRGPSSTAKPSSATKEEEDRIGF
ncbi:serine/threonine-protein kinase [Sorangium sp. So ce385]|uniref:serine/threonine-protein kinase n=1 Tax=Sorangium sp. So ce385 TaxID=3133308 RepID=UPI003F5BC03C